MHSTGREQQKRERESQSGQQIPALLFKTAGCSKGMFRRELKELRRSRTGHSQNGLIFTIMQ